MGIGGQATIELTISAAMIALVLSASGWLLRAEWDRGRCAWIVFERTHAALTGESGPPSRIAVTISEAPGSVSGSAQCGAARESVTFPKLEAWAWH